MRKEKIRVRDSDDLTERDDSSSRDEQGDREIEAVYSASLVSSEKSLETEYKPEIRLEVAPFIIGSQSG